MNEAGIALAQLRLPWVKTRGQALGCGDACMDEAVRATPAAKEVANMIFALEWRTVNRVIMTINLFGSLQEKP